MTETPRDGAAVRIPPPLLFLGAMIVGFLLQRFVLELPLALDSVLRRVAAVGATAFGAGLMIVAVALFRRTGQDPKPWESTPEIIARGPYRLSRNPMYLGMALIQAGFGLAFENGWILLALPLVMLAVYWTAIRHEEAYLEEKFGDTYLEFKTSVRRWF